MTPEQKRIVRTWLPLAKDDGVLYWKGMTLEKVRSAFKAARGTVQNDYQCTMFIAVNTKGYRWSFDYCHGPKNFCGKTCKESYWAAKYNANEWAVGDKIVKGAERKWSIGEAV